MQTEDYIKPADIDYHDGQRYPVLVRDNSQKDYLDEITTPPVPRPKTAAQAAAAAAADMPSTPPHAPRKVN